MAWLQKLAVREKSIYGPSWIAGTRANALLKVFKENHIQNVNVVATCDKLLEELQHSSNDDPIEHLNVKIPFRIITNLCVGTLRIYQHQVDDLLTRCTQLSAPLQNAVYVQRRSKKRSITSTTTYTNNKRIRLITTNQDSDIVNYSAHLNECENLKKWAEELTQTIEVTPETLLTTTRIVDMHKITLTEVTEFVQSSDTDMDSGFGNATPEEIAELTAYFKTQREPPHEIEKSNKRKTSADHDSQYKKVRISEDATIEPVRSASRQFNSSNEILPPIDCEQRFVNVNTENNSIHSTFEQNNHHAEICEQDKSQINDAFLTVNHGENILEVNSHSRIGNSIEKVPRTSKVALNKSKLIVDKCTSISIDEILAQLNAVTKGLGQDSKINKKRHFLGNFQSAEELLTLKPSKTNILKLNFKKMPTGKKQLRQGTAASEDYMNILRSIFDTPAVEDLAKQIYPTLNKGRRRNLHMVAGIQKFANADTINNNNLYKNTDCPNLPLDESSMQLNNNMETIAVDDTDSKNNCKPYNAMMQLLDIWRKPENDKEINAKSFCLAAPNRIEAALNFSSLLVLSAKGFINITKADDSCEMNAIKLGPASEEMINNLYNEPADGDPNSSL